MRRLARRTMQSTGEYLKSTSKHLRVPVSTREYRALPSSAIEYRRVPPASNFLQGTGGSVEYRRVPPSSTAEYPRRVPQSTAEYRRVPQGTAGYRRVPSSTVESRRVPQSTAEGLEPCAGRAAAHKSDPLRLCTNDPLAGASPTYGPFSPTYGPFCPTYAQPFSLAAFLFPLAVRVRRIVRGRTSRAAGRHVPVAA